MATAQSIDRSPARRNFRYLLAVFFVGAGVMHFLKPDFYVSIMPPYLPWHLPLVWISGCFEILGGVGVLFPQPLRRWAAWGLVALLVAVFPANLHVALHDVAVGGHAASPLFNWVRLPFQLVFIAWVIWCTSPLPRR
jgi:uncharacterized membrane protein